jgi:UDP-N-acetylmuramate dehydrogenase
LTVETRDFKTIFEKIDFYENHPLSEYTYTKVGGNAEVLFLPKCIEELRIIRKYATEHEIPMTVLGNASNLIIRDGGIKGFVVLLEKMNDITVNDKKVTAFAGAKLIEASEIAREVSLSGLEFASGIPGSIGGAIYMNAGAYGGEIADVFEDCQVMLKDGRLEVWTKEMMHFGYRSSALQAGGVICVSATLALTYGDIIEISQKMEELDEKRRLRQPLEYPSCGSVFKRPEGYFTGKLIQDTGLQGRIIGGAQVSTKHAGFIVNIGGASACDYEQLIALIIAEVQAKFGVTLQPEVRIIGEKISCDELQADS